MHVDIRKLPAAAAIRLAAMRHVLRHLGDAVVVGDPVWDGRTWVALLGIKGRSGTFGKLTLTEDGLIVEELSTTREELLEKLHASA